MPTARLVKPFRYIGGKYYLADAVIARIPPHQVWVEVFGGSAAVTFAKSPSDVEILNDRWHIIADFYRVLQDETLYESFLRLAVLTPYSREHWEMCRETWMLCDDIVERAYRWFVTINQSIDGRGRSWAYDKRVWHGNISACISKWLGRINGLPEVHKRLACILIECDDYRAILQRYDSPETLFYCDPPYVPETRVDKNTYALEMTVDDHAELVQSLLQVQGMVILSGYAHPVYTPLEQAGWQRVEITVPAFGSLHPGMERTRRTECLWLSPNTQRRQLRLPF